MVQECLYIGQHILTVEDEDLVVIRFIGDVDMECAESLLAAVEATLTRIGRAFLIVDKSRPGVIPPEVQRYWISWNRNHRISGIALFTESLMQHTVSMMALAAIRRLRKDMYPAVFTKNEAQARAWVAGQRARLARRALAGRDAEHRRT